MTATRPPRGWDLSDDEMRVVRCLAHGMTNPQMARELGMAPTAVSRHVGAVGAKLGVEDRAGIVGAAVRNGLLQIPVTRQVPPEFNKLLFDVLVRIARGKTNQQIGSELGLSLDTVKSRVRRLLAVLGVRSREEAVAAGVACGALRLVPVSRREQVAA